MGPPIVIGGSAGDLGDDRLGLAASMGPPIVIGGSKIRDVLAQHQPHASMGPPIVIGGSEGTPVDTGNARALQWGRRS